jgi:hypothetical protein
MLLSLPGPVHVGLVLDKVAVATVVSECFGFSFVSIIPPILHTHSFIFKAALDWRTSWRSLETILSEVGELQGRKALWFFFSPVNKLRKHVDVFSW